MTTDLTDWCRARGWALWSDEGWLTIASGIRFTFEGRPTNAPHVFIRARRGVALLWALAVEIDESGETPTGERVCRACGGRGEAWVLGYGHTWGTRHHGWTGGYPARWVEATSGSAFPEPFGQDAYETLRGVVYAAGSPWPIGAEVTIKRAEVGPPVLRRFAVVTSGPCACAGEKTSARTMLAHVVAQLASQRSPMVTDWPAQWLVDLDAMAANGWGETWLPSQGQRPASVLAERWEPLGPPRWSRWHDPAPAWQCAWWRAFWEWAHAGAEPDHAVLGPLLAERVEARRERSLAEWTAVAEAQQQAQPDGVRFARVGGEARGDGRDCPACGGRGFAESLAQVCGECFGRGRTTAQLRADEQGDAIASSIESAMTNWSAPRTGSADDIRFSVQFGVPDAGQVEIVQNRTADALAFLPPHSIAVIYDGSAAVAEVEEVVHRVCPVGLQPVVWTRAAWDEVRRAARSTLAAPDR